MKMFLQLSALKGSTEYGDSCWRLKLDEQGRIWSFVYLLKLFYISNLMIKSIVKPSPKSGPHRPKPKAVPNPSPIGTGVTQ